MVKIKAKTQGRLRIARVEAPPDRSTGNVFIERVVLRNFKSIESCEVHLKPLTILIGPNGAGKSNFLDALRFVSEALKHSVDDALTLRGGFGQIFRKSQKSSETFGIRLDCRFANFGSGFFAVEIASNRSGTEYTIRREECRVRIDGSDLFYRVSNGKLAEACWEKLPEPSDGHLYLNMLAGFPGFETVHRSLCGMGFYNILPDEMRKIVMPDVSDLLKTSGSNIAGVLRRLSTRSRDTRVVILEYLQHILSDLQDVRVRRFGFRQTIEFTMRSQGAPGRSSKLSAQSMSDGTLRALGVLTAIFQTRRDGTPAMLIGIEEPETALHPGAAGVLLDALRAASARTQIVVTSHSADLLDNKDLDPDCLLSVVLKNGATRILPINAVDRGAIIERLFTAGELQRMNQLQPDEKSFERVRKEQRRIFD